MTLHTVLVVDDEISILEVWARILAEEGYVVARATDAFGALRLLNAFPPSVAVCDVHLPGPSGVWLADLIHERSPTTAIILASGDPFIPPSETLRPAVVSYVVKPICRRELLAAVEMGLAWSADQAARALPRR